MKNEDVMPKNLAPDNLTPEHLASQINGGLNADGDPAEVFVKTLEQSNFFLQMGELKGSLTRISGDLATIGERASERTEEVETIAAHVMAIEAVLSVVLASHPVDPEAVRAEVSRRSAALSGNADGSPTVQAVARDIIAG